MDPFALIVLIVLGVVLLIVLPSTFFVVRQQNAAIVERWGKFNRVAREGLNVKIPFMERRVGNVDMRVRQIVVKVGTKTKDNVILSFDINVQFKIERGRESDWFYAMDNGEQQVAAYVQNVVRAHAPKMLLDEAYERKDELADEIKAELQAEVGRFGFVVQKALVVDITPDDRVARAMNDINAAQREAVAANARGDAEKTLRVKAAQAEAEAMRLHGEGIAGQRIAIATGMREAAEALRSGMPDASSAELMVLLLSSQYFDTLKEVASASDTNTLFLDHTPGASTGTRDLLLQALRGAPPSQPAPMPPRERPPLADTRSGATSGSLEPEPARPRV